MKDSLLAAAAVVLGVAALVGWILNIIKLFYALMGSHTAEAVVRILGIIFAPLGAIAGYF